jgi:hypothetical protein
MPDNPLFVPSLRPPTVGTAKAINLRPNASLSASSNRVENLAQTMLQAEGMSSSGKKKTKKGNRRKGKGGESYTNPSFSESSSDSSSNDSFNVDTKRTVFYDDRRTEPVKFDMPISDTTAILPLEKVATTDAANANDNTKLMVNTATYVRSAFTEANSTAGYPVYDHYRTLFALMSKTVMATIKSKLIDEFTFGNFYNYIMRVASALECYYTLDAILSYSSQTDDKNSGLINVQSRLTEADLFTAQNELRRALKGHWFPNKFSELIRWTYQIYKTSPTHQGCNYMFFPTDVLLYKDVTEDIAVPMLNLVNSQISNLNDGPNALLSSKLASVLGQTYPEGIIRGLPLSSSTATYDPQHYEMFINQPTMFNSGTAITSFPAIDTHPDIVYARDCNPGERSGMPFCLQNINKEQALGSSGEGGAGSIDFFRCFSKVDGTSVYNTNKFTLAMTPTEGFISRNLELITNEAADVHVVACNSSNVVSNKTSCQKSGFQRVYFDNAIAPLINLRNFMDELFEFAK